MRILLAFPRPLIPADTGGKIRSLEIFSRLAKREEIHAVSQADPDTDAEGIAAMKKMFASYTPVYWKESIKYSPSFYLDLVVNQFSSYPYFIAKFRHPQFTQALTAVAGSREFDVFFCDFLQTAAPILDLAMRPRVVFEHNVEYLLRKRQWETESMPLKKRIFAGEWTKTRSVEARICKSFDRVIAVSDEDRHAFESEFDVSNVSTIPTGVDANYFQPQDAQPKPGRLVFVGSMDWYPNEDGIIWFLKEVFPRIRKDVPHASFAIVGRNPSAAVKAIAAEADVILTGRVPDVRSYLAEAEVVVVPLRVGGGTRIKIPEAMAMRKALVSTTIGAEGLPLKNGIEIQLEDDPEKFARAVVELLQNANRRAALENAARDCVVRDFGWESVVDRVQEILIDVTASKGLRNHQAQSNQLATVRGS